MACARSPRPHPWTALRSWASPYGSGLLTTNPAARPPTVHQRPGQPTRPPLSGGLASQGYALVPAIDTCFPDPEASGSTPEEVNDAWAASSLVHPRADGVYQRVYGILYLTHVTVDTAPTYVADRAAPRAPLLFVGDIVHRGSAYNEPLGRQLGHGGFGPHLGHRPPQGVLPRWRRAPNTAGRPSGRRSTGSAGAGRGAATVRRAWHT
ncbi:hypothetical protein ACFVYT_22700 [Streptomyces sp. NPDC058290]|uniref:hypothetical protein n=1 Tax=unclassified Streptomyces TaxID=2593676 RepID=UPI0036ED8464